jgi:hypothetical protein
VNQLFWVQVIEQYDIAMEMRVEPVLFCLDHLLERVFIATLVHVVHRNLMRCVDGRVDNGAVRSAVRLKDRSFKKGGGRIADTCSG